MITSRIPAVGYLFATLAYLGWGFFPIYWKQLKDIPALEILSHRVIWSFIFYFIVLSIRERRIRLFVPASIRISFTLFLAAAVLMSNWFVYIYAVNSNRIVETSLGYFINPIVSIALGVLVLKERLSLIQKVAVAFATTGVFIVSLDQTGIPWIALFLALSFSIYGLIKKLNPMPGLHSNQFESAVMIPVAVVMLLLQSRIIGVQPFPLAVGFDFGTAVLLAGAGVVTGLPLVFFAEAAQRIPFYLLGFFQFIAPSIQFLSGVLIYGEPLSQQKMIGFIFIWGACFLLLSGNTITATFTNRRGNC